MVGRQRIGIAHVCMGHGGSEACAMWGIEALKEEWDVSLLTAGEVDLEGLNAFFGTSVRSDQVVVRQAPLLPFMRARTDGAALRCGLFQRFCRRIAGEFDVLVSAYNPCDFGVPAIHFVSDFSWNRELLEELHPIPPAARRLVHRDGPLRTAYLAVARGCSRPSGRDLFGGKDIMVANSPFTAGLLKERFGLDVAVVYPPVQGENTGVAFEDRERGFVCLGRVAHEKRIDRIIGVLGRIRRLGHDIHLHVIGPIDQTPYGKLVRRLCDEHRDWVFPEGELAGERKSDLLSRHRYGIHGCPGEAFGMAVAEMAKAGCVTFVPALGFPADIVGDPRLCFQDEEDAVRRIDAMLRNEPLQRELSMKLCDEGECYSPQRFMREFLDVVESFSHGARRSALRCHE